MNKKKQNLKIFIHFEPPPTFNEEFIKFVEEILSDWQKNKNGKIKEDKNNTAKSLAVSKFI
jgi:hypothetical protein